MTVRAVATKLWVRMVETGDIGEIDTDGWFDTETKKLTLPGLSEAIAQPYVIISVEVNGALLHFDLGNDEVIDPARHPVTMM